MLFFTYPYDLSEEVKQKMRELLERETGETCLILDMGCTGVYYAPDRPDQLKETHPFGNFSRKGGKRC